MRYPAVAIIAAALSIAASQGNAGESAAPGPSHVEKTFLVPAAEGYGVADCLTGGKSECGQVVADSWCESQGFASAANYGVAASDEYTGAIDAPAPVERPIRITCQD